MDSYTNEIINIILNNAKNQSIEDALESSRSDINSVLQKLNAYPTTQKTKELSINKNEKDRSQKVINKNNSNVAVQNLY